MVSTTRGLVTLTASFLAVALVGCGEDLTPQLNQSKERVKALEGELAQANNRADQLDQEKAELDDALDALRGTELTETPKPKEVSVSLRSDVLFGSGSVELTSTGIKLLKKLSRIMKKRSEQSIRIEGHTDNVVPDAVLKDRYPSNWELGAARAASLGHYLTWTEHINPSRFVVVSHGQYRPVVPNTNGKARKKNRRVKIVMYDESQ